MSVRGRRVPTLFLAFIVFLATIGTPEAAAAATAGLDLSWSDCGSFGAAQKTFACERDAGRLVLVASAIAGVNLPRVNGQAGVLELQTSAPELPPWWQLSGSGCRAASPGALTADFDFTAGGSCSDPWQGQAMGGVNYASTANRARIRTVCAIAGTTAIAASEEYACFKVTISTTKASASGGCPGCTEGACFVLDSILLSQPAGVGDATITAALGRNFVQWQGGASSPGATSACAGASVETAKTWGGLKSLYR